MSALELPELGDLVLDTARGELAGGRLKLSGTLAMRAPLGEVQPYLRKVHEGALAAGLDEVTLDLVDLTFVNSSSLRLFIDWVGWLRDLPEAERYVLEILVNPSLTWQRTSFPAIQSIAGTEILRITEPA